MKKPLPTTSDQRLRVGALALVVTLLLVAALVLVVVVGDALEQRFALRVDLSYNGITTLERNTVDALSQLTQDVHIYALFTPGQEDSALLGLLQRYAAASPHITYSMENLLQNPMLANTFSDLPDDNAVTTDSLVVKGMETGRVRVLDGTNYIVKEYDAISGDFAISGYKYEKSLTEAILFVTADTLPAIRLLTGHGELGGDRIAALTSVLRDANFEVSTLNLLSGQTLDPGDLLMILSPGRDLLAQELELIETFVNEGGSLLITSDFDAPEHLPGFTELYRMYGFSLKPGIVVAEADQPADYYETPVYLMPYMQPSTITADLLASRRTTLIMPGARAFDVAGAADARVEPVLQSGQAYIRSIENASQTLDKADNDEEGTFTLALFSTIETSQGNSARAFAIGSSATFTDAWLHTNTYSVELLMQALNALGARTSINLDIAQKQAIRPPLNLRDSVMPGILLAAAPLMVIIPAWLVYRDRRRKA